MKLHQKILTGILLVLIGVVAGVGFMLFQNHTMPFVPTEVQITEVKRSNTPAEVHYEAGGYPAFSIRDVAREVVPTVVYIETTVSGRSLAPENGNHNFEEEFWDRLIPRNRSNAVGSGVIISDDGFILTNNHVVAGGRDIRVTLHDKRQFDARIIGRDPSTDLAVLKIEGDDLPSIVLGDSDHLEVGDWVMAVGNPLRLRSTITAGIVSALGRDVQIINDRMRIESFIQTDAAINKGNSGGALVNTSGELVGINTAIATESGMNQGYGFAIPINMAFKIGRDLMEFGEVQRAFLGVQIVGVDQTRARQLGMESIRGVEISGVVSGGAAEVSGIREGDVVLSVNNRQVNETNELQAQVALFRPRDIVDVTIWRNGEVLDKQIELVGMDNQAISEWSGNNSWQDLDVEIFPEAEREFYGENGPSEETENEPSPDATEDKERSEKPSSIQFDLGFTVEEMNIDEHRMLGIQMRITQVRRFSAARRAGLRQNDIILSVNGSRAESLTHLENMISRKSAEDGMKFMILRGAEIMQIDF
jgi:serine protease Do